MTAPMTVLNDCPTAETIAAFVDDRLDSATRRQVSEHIADCGDCRELVLMTMDIQQENNVRHGTFGARRWIAAAAGLAAAAVIAVFLLRPTAPDINDVRAASTSIDERPFSGRLLDFPYKKEIPRFRSGNGDKEDESQLVTMFQVAADLAEAKSPDPLAKGVASLYLKDRSAAIKELERAYKARGNDHDAVEIALATALLEQGDYERALGLSEDVLKRKQIPEAAWNRAIALDRLGRDKDAIGAWDEYLALEKDPEWAAEGKRQRDRLFDIP
jgi:tetratricopeptide (TPR) repeat protein